MTRFFILAAAALLCSPAAAAMTSEKLVSPWTAVTAALGVAATGCFAGAASLARDRFMRAVYVLLMAVMVGFVAAPALAGASSAPFVTPAQAQTVAPAGETPVVVGYGEYVVAIMNSFVKPLIITLIGILGTYLVGLVRGYLTEAQANEVEKQIEAMLTNILDMGVNAVEGAVKGQAFSVDTGSKVLNEALRYAAREVSPDLIAKAGGLDGVAMKAFRKMFLDASATTGNVLDPALKELPTIRLAGA